MTDQLTTTLPLDAESCTRWLAEQVEELRAELERRRLEQLNRRPWWWPAN